MVKKSSECTAGGDGQCGPRANPGVGGGVSLEGKTCCGCSGVHFGATWGVAF